MGGAPNGISKLEHLHALVDRLPGVSADRKLALIDVAAEAQELLHEAAALKAQAGRGWEAHLDVAVGSVLDSSMPVEDSLLCIVSPSGPEMGATRSAPDEVIWTLEQLRLELRQMRREEHLFKILGSLEPHSIGVAGPSLPSKAAVAAPPPVVFAANPGVALRTATVLPPGLSGSTSPSRTLSSPSMSPYVAISTPASQTPVLQHVPGGSPVRVRVEPPRSVSPMLQLCGQRSAQVRGSQGLLSHVASIQRLPAPGPCMQLASLKRA
eukprot:gnl/TRDRNA2_/TRDRNA2_36002_c0_seq1.p1 gnl/TRDRNA2_/TRDRNA2_36002_c0~~gnl/TRDRNA2_/TRDRNA2_36002_c0_seq1.p1  ORF type:complete len:281 (-),score=31.89 gnl/TRDRNA2_/TRDRNA2_36002_c0_seq1:90-890(-)